MPSPLRMTASEGGEPGRHHRDGPAQALGHDRIIDQSGRRLAVRRFGTDKAGYADLLAAGRRHPERVWAVEGCNGIGKHIAHRLVHDGEVVVDLPPKLSAQVRVFATGNGRKTDPVDARWLWPRCTPRPTRAWVR